MADDLLEQLRLAIRASGMSLNEIQKVSGVDRGVTSRLMRGERDPTVATVHRLAAALNYEIHLRPRRRARSNRSR